MGKKKSHTRVRTGRRAKQQERGPSLLFYVALILGLILLAYLGYIAATTKVTPPAVTTEQSEQ